jgi:hypothetical protein
MNLQDTVLAVVEDFINKEVLFTALDVSNEVKMIMPHARHREVRDVVRSIFTTNIENQGWARTPITVTLGDGTTAEALLYHPLTASWDLDSKYTIQQRAQSSLRPMATAQTVVVAAQAARASAPVPPPIVNVSATALAAAINTSMSAPAPVTPLPTARTLWDDLFQKQPSLFPTK